MYQSQLHSGPELSYHPLDGMPVPITYAQDSPVTGGGVMGGVVTDGVVLTPKLHTPPPQTRHAVFVVCPKFAPESPSIE
jgi:hypothetical protein